MIKNDVKVIILDTSVFLSGKPIDFRQAELVTSLSVTDELKPGGRDHRNFEYHLQRGLKILSPSVESIKKIKETAKQTGDIKKLSKTDMDLLAIAIDLMKNNTKICLLTDDYSIQNVADNLDIYYEGLNQYGIKKRFKWTYRCQGCKKNYKEHLNNCPICGSKLKNVIAKKQKKREK